jgi:ribulose-5-phosphate 4-epimerase/fuculose-1-phosphate aldolase
MSGALRKTDLRPSVSDAEWQARVDLAAAHRVAVYYKWDYLIYNHIAMRVPGEEDHFLIKPNGLRFKEVKASNLLKLPLDTSKIPLDSGVQAAGFTIHTAVLRARADINCTMHVHTPHSVAMSAREGGLLPLDQGAMRFYKRLSYHDFEGQANDLDEAARIARDLGPTNKAMMMRNHGPLTCGADPGEAIALMYFLTLTCEIQMMLEASGAKIRLPSPEVCEHAAAQWDEHQRGVARDEWPGYLRIVEEIDPSYKD